VVPKERQGGLLVVVVIIVAAKEADRAVNVGSSPSHPSELEVLVEGASDGGLRGPGPEVVPGRGDGGSGTRLRRRRR
jgi:hypothetical protein